MTTTDTRVFAIVQEYLAAREAGVSPSRETLLAQHAEIAEPLGRCLDALDFVGTLAPPSGGPGIGMSIGEFVLLAEIGRGGMGIVYEADQPSLGRHVAIKVLPFASALDPVQRQRFDNEARAAAGLHHPHIVPIHAVAEVRGAPYFAMQLIVGRPLAEWLREETFAWQGHASRAEVVARLGISAAEALAYAHQQGVVHRDIKPGNLLVEPSGHLWIVDFGLARVEGMGALTATDALAGTPRYMSPEQAAGRAIDHRTDQYSLAVTLYEALVQRPANTGETREEVLRQLLHGEPVPPRSVDRQVPRDLETILLKAMARNPAERYDDCQAFADDLRRFVAGEPVKARRPGVAERLGKWAWRRRASFAALVFAILVGLGTAVGVLLAKNAEVRQSEQTALSEKAKAEAALAREREVLYEQGVNLAWREWQAGNANRARQLLADCPEEWRRWEWHYLRRTFEARRVLPVREGTSPRVLEKPPCFSSDSTVLALWHRGGITLFDAVSGAARGHTPLEGELAILGAGPRGEILVVSEGAAYPKNSGLGSDRIHWLDTRTGNKQPVFADTRHRALTQTFWHGGRFVLRSGTNLVVMKQGDHTPVLEMRQVQRVAAHPTDADRLFFLDAGGAVGEVHVATGERRTLFQVSGKSLALVPVPDGSVLAVFDEAGLLWRWRLKDQKRSAAPLSLAHYPRGPFLSGSVASKTAGRSENFDLVYLDAGRLLARFGSTVPIILNANTGEVIEGLPGHAQSVLKLALSPDCRHLVTCDTQYETRLWDVAAPRRDTRFATSVVKLVFSPDGGRLAVQHVRGISLLNSATGALVWEDTPNASKGRTPRAVWFEKGGKMAGLFAPGVIRTCEQSSGKLLHQRSLSRDPETTPSSLYSDGKSHYVESGKGQIVVRRLADGAVAWRRAIDSTTTLTIHFDPIGERIVTAQPTRGNVEVNDATGEIAAQRTAPRRMSGVHLSPRGTYLAVRYQDGTMDLWHANDLSDHLHFEAGRWVFPLVFAPAEDRLAVVRGDRQGRELAVMDPATGREILTLTMPTPITALAFSPDGNRLAVAMRDGAIRVLDGSP